MIRHIFLDKTNTIFKGSNINLGNRPTVELNYGQNISRVLLHFNEKEIKELFEDKTFANNDKFHAYLKMTNCCNIEGIDINKKVSNGSCALKDRASSFNLLLMELPMRFDQGRGFDYGTEDEKHSDASFQSNGSNWYQSYNGKLWIDETIPGSYNGVYSTEKIIEEYNKFSAGDISLIVNRQHFDIGNEDLNIDITKYILSIIGDDKENYGLMLCYTPMLEDTKTENQQYIAFFDDLTNTFYHPYVELVYDEVISDDREYFYIGKTNRLYLYNNIDGELDNLDEEPVCEIDGKRYPVHQASKGVYYIEVKMDDCEPNEIHCDTWSNLVYNDEELEDIEMEFATMDKSKYYRAGNKFSEKKEVVPSLIGINNEERLERGEIREVEVEFRKKYETNYKENIKGAEYRLYVKDGEREYEIFNGYHPIERTFLYDFFVINTKDLIPNTYYVDIRIKSGKEEKYFKNKLMFKVIDKI